MADVLQLDDNLVNGRTYVFQFDCTNMFWCPKVDVIQDDIYQYAPDFVQSLGVTSPTLTTLYNVQFTYEGDGSDVVSDLAQSFVGAFLAGSNDNFRFVGAVAATSAYITVTPSNAAGKAEQAVIDAANKVATDVTKTATGTVNTALQGLLPLLIVIVAIVLFVVPSFVKSTGARVSVG